MPEAGGDGKQGWGMPQPCLRRGLGGDFGRGETAEAGMGPRVVVVVLPIGQDSTGMGQ